MTAIEQDATRTARILRMPTADDDKYSRGVVGLRTGSADYPGAAVLGVSAAWRTGCGMVRYIGPSRAADMVLAHRPETVTAPGRVQAWVIGSGTDAASRDASETEALREVLAGREPVVVDAGALDLAPDATAPMILTPHGREFARLRDALGLAPIGDREAETAQTAREMGAVVLLKGAVTLVADPDGGLRRIRSGVPWLATAGTGDVLAGALGAVVAGAVVAGEPSPARLADAAAAAAWLHGHAGALAAGRRGSRGGPITAGDVAEHLPWAVGETLAAHR
ncbi:NAD(P)H-hydrate dehydratase [Microbacterium sp. RG1]|uniref:NAD(P)H-hydrate dehydratase n=1 Tax=Microbacterium sp. RG1 TaxID=2489212 RepID=UPI0010CA3409|nr:NAD(P)H-hydrate dehydratase [Microbacterium sp. RG1]QCQ15448.1 NAD(P)H-hydrate dehydratase [Microbacterium sp. RG1]